MTLMLFLSMRSFYPNLIIDIELLDEAALFKSFRSLFDKIIQKQRKMDKTDQITDSHT